MPTTQAKQWIEMELWDTLIDIVDVLPAQLSLRNEPWIRGLSVDEAKSEC